MDARSPVPRAGRILALVIVGLVAAPDLRAGSVFISGDDSDDSVHCREARCGGMIGHILSDLYSGCGPLPPGDCILAIGTNFDEARSALIGPEGWNLPQNGGPGACIVECNDVACIDSVRFEDYRLLYVPSAEISVDGGLTQPQLDALNRRRADIQAWVNGSDGRVMALTEAFMRNAFGWLPNPLASRDTFIFDARRTPKPHFPGIAVIDEQFPGNGSTDDNIDHSRYHTIFVGPSGWSGLSILLEAENEFVRDPANGQAIHAPLALGCCQCLLLAEDCDNGIDDDGDTLVDEDDLECGDCGDGVLNPGEECDDGNQLDFDGCDSSCHVETNGRPTCVVAGPVATDCADVRAGRLQLDGRGSSDPDSDPLSFLWSTECAGISFDDDESPTPVVIVDDLAACSVTCEVELAVTDPAGASSSCETMVTISDESAPVIEQGSGGDACIWPPNHWYTCFNAGDFHPVITDACNSPIAWRFVGCASDQPDDAPDGRRARGWNGDGNTADDCVVAADGLGFCVRAERTGAGEAAQDGRHYAVSIVATDACGNESAPVVIGTVHVPHDQSPRARDCVNPTRVGVRRGAGRR
jgi:cysteine-rich repeat protein